MSAASLRRRLAAIVGEAQVVTATSRREPYARDASAPVFLAAREGERPPLPELVVLPGRTEEVAAVIRLCRETGTPVTPYGGGTGLAGGAVPVRGGVVLGLQRFDAVGEVDPQDRLVTAGAGVVGLHLEQRLERQGYTAGHLPASLNASTVGGWIATRSAGQGSSRYGTIEDIVAGLTFVDGAGAVHRFEPGTRAALGADPVQLILGSEGVLGVVTEAVLRVHRTPEVRYLRGVRLPSVDAGLEAMRRIVQAGLRPGVLRLHDPLESFARARARAGSRAATGAGQPGLLTPMEEPRRPGLLSGPTDWLAGALHAALRRPAAQGVQRGLVRTLLGRPAGLSGLLERVGPRALLILAFEGQDERLAAHDERRALEICAAVGGEDLGRGPAERWFAERFSAGFRVTHALDAGAFVDTLETATTWERLPGLYETVRDVVRPHALVLSRFVHAFEDSCALELTFAGFAATPDARRRALEQIRGDAREAILASGGTLSHHHGLGTTAPGLVERGLCGGLPVLRVVRSVMDPGGIMNPGKLGLGAEPTRPGSGDPAPGPGDPTAGPGDPAAGPGRAA